MDEFEVEVVTTEQKTTKPSNDQKIYKALRWLLKPRLYVWLALGLTTAILLYGTPHLIITYKCYKSNGKCYRYTDCNYIGIQGWRKGWPIKNHCSYVRVFPIRW